MIQKVRAKMEVNVVESTTYQETAKLNAVYGGTSNAEDNSYASATPSGKLELCVSNPAVKGFFKPGKKYYLDITEVPDEMPAAK